MNKINCSLLIGVLTVASAYGAQGGWQSYQNSSLHFGLKLPAQWQVEERSNVVGFTSPALGSSYAAMGILKSSKRGMTLQEAASRKLGVSARSEGWTISMTQFSGLPAVKVISTQKKDPSRRMVQYYVQSGDDLYLIQCIAPTSEWSQYNAFFATMIRTFQFSLQ